MSTDVAGGREKAKSCKRWRFHGDLAARLAARAVDRMTLARRPS